MHTFELIRSASLADAARQLTNAADARLIAGGQTLVPSMKHGLAQPTHLVDLARLPGLRGIRIEAGKVTKVTIGAMTPHAQVAESADVRKAIPALADLAVGIGDRMVRNLGTIGGSLANNDPAADYPAAVLGLGATVVTDQRRIAADDFFTGMFSTALDTGEIIVEVEFPVPQCAGYAKFRNPASRYATTGVFVARTAQAVRVAVTGAAACVFRFAAMEVALAKSFAADSANNVALPPDGLISDIHASADYRANLATVMAARAVESALASS